MHYKGAQSCYSLRVHAYFSLSTVFRACMRACVHIK